jgi:hypothetical protein
VGNDKGGDDDDGDILANGAQMWGADKPRAQQAPNNNADGPNANPFDWDDFLD